MQPQSDFSAVYDGIRQRCLDADRDDAERYQIVFDNLQRQVVRSMRGEPNCVEYVRRGRVETQDVWFVLPSLMIDSAELSERFFALMQTEQAREFVALAAVLYAEQHVNEVHEALKTEEIE